MPASISIGMGRTGRGDPASLGFEALLATRLLVQGNSGSGKSHLLRRLLEQSAPWVQQVVTDPSECCIRTSWFGAASLPGAPPDLPSFTRRLATARAGLEHAVTMTPGWDEVASIARTLPDDAQGVYLLLARTALTAAPCPPDAVLARVYGTRSPARARRVLSYLEQQGVVVCPEAHDWRAVAIPGLGWRTAPGDPAAPDDEIAC